MVFFRILLGLAIVQTAMVTILITLIWQSKLIFYGTYVAGIESIDRTYYEAALIDGAVVLAAYFLRLHFS